MRLFVTGASSGLGEALVRECRHRHPQAEIGLVARRASELERVAAAVGGPTRTYALDVNDRAALSAAAARFLAEAGVPDVVIANAGISAGTVTGEADDAAVFERILRTNVVAMFDSFAPFVEPMRAAGRGRLVGIASVAGIRGLPGGGAYSASKAAAITYLESLRLELRDSGVKVVTVAPGYIRTPMTAKNPYTMPFLMEADAFAREAWDTIEVGTSYRVIPWQMGVVAKVLRALPNPVYDALFARAPRKPRLAK